MDGAKVVCMMFKDIVYGSVDVDEPVIKELSESKAMQRIKGICNQGVPKKYIADFERDYSRFDHCVGVMLVLRKVGASLEEQVAGLLHDVSHTAFSHLVDYVIGKGTNEDYQDSIHSRFFGNGTELYEILKSNGMDPEMISEPKNFGLLEREQPCLCADRFDNTAREWAESEGTDKAKAFVESLVSQDGYLAFKSIDTAKNFAIMHERWVPEIPGNKYGHDMSIRWYIFGSAIKIAMKNGMASKEDFGLTDAEFLEKLENTGIEQVDFLLSYLASHKGELQYEIAEKDPKVLLHYKFRYLDPFFVKDGKLVRVSEADGSFAERIERNRAMNKKGIGLASIEGIGLPIRV